MALDQQIIDLYDEYTHRPLARRVFLERLTLAGRVRRSSGAALPFSNRTTPVRRWFPRPIRASRRERWSRRGSTGSRSPAISPGPKARASIPAVIVIHENRGLNPHIEDVARRFAADGFLAFGVDFLMPLGGTPEDADAAREMFTKLAGEGVVSQAQGRADAYLRERPLRQRQGRRGRLLLGRRHGQHPGRARTTARRRRVVLWRTRRPRRRWPISRRR